MKIDRKVKLTYEVEIELHAYCNEEEIKKMLDEIRDTFKKVKKERRGSYIFKVKNVSLRKGRS